MKAAILPIVLSIVSLSLAAPIAIDEKFKCTADNYNHPECRRLMDEGPQNWELEISKNYGKDDSARSVKGFNKIPHAPSASITTQDVLRDSSPQPSNWVPYHMISITKYLTSPSALKSLSKEEAHKLLDSLVEEGIVTSEMSAKAKLGMSSSEAQRSYIHRCRERMGTIWQARRLKYFPPAQNTQTVEISELVLLCAIASFVLGAIIIEKSRALAKAARKMSNCFRRGRISLDGDANSWPERGRTLHRVIEKV